MRSDPQTHYEMKHESLRTRLTRRLVYFLSFLMVFGGQPALALQETVRIVPREEHPEWLAPWLDGATYAGAASHAGARTTDTVEELQHHLGTWWDGAWSAPWASLTNPSEPLESAVVPTPIPVATGAVGSGSSPWLVPAILGQSGGSTRLPKMPDVLDGDLRPPAEAVRRMAAKADLESIPLIPGMNLISLPEEPTSTDPAEILAPIGGSYTRILIHDACDSTDPWKVYDPNDASTTDLTALDHTDGIWIEAKDPVSLPSDGTLPATTTFQLCTGWNLIGYPAGRARTVRNALHSIDGKWVRVYGYDASDPGSEWQVYDVGVPEWGNDLREMLPGRGYWVLVTEDATLEIANDGPEPFVAFEAPADLDVVTDFTDVVGTVRSPILENWRLTYQRIGEGESVEIATGRAPVESGILGTFDPTLLVNGLYELKLEAEDEKGRFLADSIAVAVEGNMKIGHFTLSFVDLAIPLSGLDIEILRTYDSREKDIVGDFGHGWTLDIRQGSYQNNRPPGDGWQIVNPGGPFGLPCSETLETKSHLTTVTLSDQEVYRFRLSLTEQAAIIGGCQARAFFEWVDGPLPGTTLEILGNDLVIYENESERLIDQDSLELFEPRNVKLTTRDGRIFHVNLETDVTHLEDLNGNAVDITVDGITHSSGVGIDFVRDAEGRIVEIVDPRGNTNLYSYDLQGDLAKHTDRAGAETRFDYREHYLEDIHNALGVRAVRTEYDDEGRMVRSTDAAGNTLSFDHDFSARRETITDRLGFVQVMEYDSRGNVVREIDKLGNVTQRTFDSKDNILSETDPLDHTTTFTYTAANDLASTTDPLGNKTVSTYNSFGQVLTTTDPRGNVTTKKYDARGNLVSTTDATGNVTSFTYDGSGNLLSETDALGNVRSFQYDGVGNLIREIDTLGNETTYTHNSYGEVLTRSHIRTVGSSSETLTTTYTYNELGRVVNETAPDGTVKSNRYDALGQIVASIDELGRTTSMEYDTSGNLTSITYPDGTSVRQVYDAENRVVGLKSRAGKEVDIVRDAMGRHLRSKMPDGAVTTNKYDAAGQIISQTAANGATLKYSYDAAGRQIAITDAFGTVTKSYDPTGNQIASTDPLGHTTTMAYDALNRRTSVTYPDGTSDQMTYDALGRRASSADQSRGVTLFDYDAEGRLVSVTNALGQETKYSYDELGSRVAQTDAEGRTTTFSYDRLGRRTVRTYPGGATERFTYHPDGTLASRTDPNGAKTLYHYNDNKQLIRRSYPDGSEVKFTYTDSGQRKTYTDDRGLTSYTYDARDRVTSITYPDGRSLHYTYDGLGKRTSMTAVVGTSTFETTYDYDELSRLASVTDQLGRTTTLRYDSNGNLVSFAYPNGVTTALGYDSLNRLVHLATEDSETNVLQSYEFTLSATGNRTAIREASGISRYYTYDKLNRLTRDHVEDDASALLYQEDFAYDSVGNRLRLTRDEGDGPMSTAYSYDQRDRLVSQGGVGYGWDANGNRASKDGPDGAHYSWDYENRLTAVTLGDGSQVRFSYDPDGVLVRREVVAADGGPTIVTDYLNDTAGSGLSQVVVESVGTAVDTVYTRAGGHLVSLYRPGSETTRYYHSDALGSVRLLTDEMGGVTDSYDYTGFGALLAHDGTDPQPYQFAGEPFDAKSGFNYHRARWLDMSTGRFTSEDPLLGRAIDPMSLHRYLYANADPVGRVDPTGLFSSVNAGLTALSIGLAVSGITGVTFFSLALHFAPKEGILKSPPEAFVFGGQWGFNTEWLTTRFKHPLVFGILAGLMAFSVYPGFELLFFNNRLVAYGTFGVAVGVPVGGPFGGRDGVDGYIGAAFNTESGAAYPGHSFCTGFSIPKIPSIQGACFSTNRSTYTLTLGKYSSYGEKIVSSWAWASSGHPVPYPDLDFDLPTIPSDINGIEAWGDELFHNLLAR